MANFLQPEKVASLINLMDSGHGIRATAAALGVSKNTVTRYYRAGPPKLCGCGKSLLHRGWCSVRIQRSPARQSFLAKWHKPHGIIQPRQAPVLLRYPYIAEGLVNVDSIMLKVNDAVPHGLPDHVRADVCQDMLVAVLSQEFPMDDIARQSRAYVRRYFSEFGQRRDTVSLDAIVRGADGLRLIDTIADDREHF